MKYLLGQRSIPDWSINDQLVIEEAIAFVQQPPNQNIYVQAALFLHRVTGADYICVGQTVTEDKKNVKTLAFTYRGQVLDNITYCTIGTPCENVLGQNFCYFPDGIQELFPTDIALLEMQVHSYMGMPLNDREDNTIGLLSMLHSKPIADPVLAEHLLFIIASLLEEGLNG
jgi:hypothetical protein